MMGRKNTNARKRQPAPENIATPTPEQLNRSPHVRVTISAEDGSKAAPYVNTGHDPIARWKAAGRLCERQLAAIDTVRRLWDVTGLRQRLTANYGQTIIGSVSAETCSNMVIDAKTDLARIESYFMGLAPWWRVFVDVCRFGIPAGVAGSELGVTKTGNDIRAHTIVAMFSSVIADRERL